MKLCGCAVALTASNAYTRSQSFRLEPGETVTFAGHTFTYVGHEPFDTRVKFGVKALVDVDGEQVYAPAITTYKGRGASVPTPSVRTGLTNDIYLTLGDPAPQNDVDPARLTVAVKPMILWLWVGGALMAVGTVLAAFPGRRRRAIDPVSAPVPDETATPDNGVTLVPAPAPGGPEPDLEVSTRG